MSVVMRRADGALVYRAISGDKYDPHDSVHSWTDVKRGAQLVQAFRDLKDFEEADKARISSLEYLLDKTSTTAIYGGDPNWEPDQPMPSWIQNLEYRPAPSWFRPEWARLEVSMTYPHSRKLPDGSMLISACRMLDNSYEIMTLDVKDHPNIKLLPEDAPKAVRAMYTASNQLAFARATSCDFDKTNAAKNAWRKYWLNRLPLKPINEESK